ncbi:outer membrane protein assembly factor BamC [Hydrogenophaga electricum]|uniref:Lipoprotein n=1 Tax=Hydrogenophaga electricum TaxID=1230953 RepID=A0ABQ6C1A4_9BURK|nr:lipoprotein [Hydrogenophaga electricum]
MRLTESRLLRSPSRLGTLAMAAALLGGCSVLQEDKIDYKSAQRGNTLAVPPDLTQLSRDPRFQVPGDAVSANSYQAAQPTAAQATAGNTAAASLGDVRIERAGTQRWLVVNRPADQLWAPVKEFWEENGFLLQLEQQNLGIMETDWAENRAKIPQDFIRSTIGKVFENLYSTGERDRFRTRLERNASGGTEIYISHRGLEEVYTSSQKEQTVWQPRAADPELEAEFLRRLMVRLGASEAQAKAAVATAPSTPPAARVVTENGVPTVQLEGDFDRAWRRVGLSLDRSGFTVEDRDRSQGVYFVRYMPAGANETAKPGFFSRLFSGTPAAQGPDRYRIQVRSTGSTAAVTVLDGQGQPASSENARRIAQLLADDLK